MKKLILLLLFPFANQAQNVGIGNPSPTEKLDVTGNINVTGTIKANGVAGSQNQVLTTNSMGDLAWADACEYKNFESISSVFATTWVPPVGVTKILVEVWGAGGGGNIFAGGGGGGYVKALFDITPTSIISLAIGDGGAGGNTTTNGINGTSTSFSVTNLNTQTITASPGGGALYLTANNGQGGFGGTYSVTSNQKKYIGLEGSSGQSIDRSYYQYSATTFYEKGIAGRGGNSGNSETGGLGQTYLLNTTAGTLILRNGNPSAGKIPGGGGASGFQYTTGIGTTNIAGGAGGDGLIIIRY